MLVMEEAVSEVGRGGVWEISVPSLNFVINLIQLKKRSLKNHLKVKSED